MCSAHQHSITLKIDDAWTNETAWSNTSSVIIENVQFLNESKSGASADYYAKAVRPHNSSLLEVVQGCFLITHALNT